MIAVVQTLYRWKLFLIVKAFCLLLYFFRPNCFQIVVQHFSEEQYIFYFAGEATEQAQVNRESALYCHRKWSNKAETHTHSQKYFYTHTFIFLRAEGASLKEQGFQHRYLLSQNSTDWYSFHLSSARSECKFIPLFILSFMYHCLKWKLECWEEKSRKEGKSLRTYCIIYQTP